MERILLLYSGGLDSLLAARVLIEAGACVEAVHFVTPYTGSNERITGEEYLTSWGIPLRRITIDVDEFRPLLEKPPHGFGRALNPCIDCKILFCRKAKQILLIEGFSAVATGSVVGERPMSQNLAALGEIERKAELEGFLIRPLSALLLTETEVEKNGNIARTKLYGIQGRGRKPQLELARKWDITEYATPAGGCLLTEPLYTRKLTDLMDREEDNDETVALLKTGRHFRLEDGPKLIVGRNKEENEELLSHKGENRVSFEVKGVGSPIGLLFSQSTEKRVFLWAASIVARYSDDKNEELVNVTCQGAGYEDSLSVTPSTSSQIETWRI